MEITLTSSAIDNINYYCYYYYYYYYYHYYYYYYYYYYCLYVLELTFGFESNLNNNAVRKKEKYLNLINEISRNYLVGDFNFPSIDCHSLTATSSDLCTVDFCTFSMIIFWFNVISIQQECLTKLMVIYLI